MTNRIALLAAVLALVVTACGGDPSPRRPEMPSDHQYPGGPQRVTRVVGRELPRATAPTRPLARRRRNGGQPGDHRPDPAGYPFGSVVSYGLDESGEPLFVISQLAEHTRNLGADPRASLLVTEPTSRASIRSPWSRHARRRRRTGERRTTRTRRSPSSRRGSRRRPATPATATSSATA